MIGERYYGGSSDVDGRDPTTDWQVALREWRQYYPDSSVGHNFTDVSPDEEQCTESQSLSVTPEIVPWLSDEERADGLPVLHIERGGNYSVMVVDARTENLKEVEAKMARKSPKDFESTGKRTLSATLEELKQYARQMSGSYDGRLSGLKIVRKTSSDYPLPVLYRARNKANVSRVYVCQLSVDQVPNGSTVHAELQEVGIDSICFFVAACDKQNQLKALELLTGLSPNEIVQRHAGSV